MIQKLGIDLKKNNLFAYIYIILINIYYGLRATQLNNPNLHYILYMAVIIFFIQVCFFENYRLLEVFILPLLIVFCMLNYHYSNDSRLLVLALTIIIMKSVKFESCLKLIFYERILITICIISLSIIGVIPNIERYVNDRTAYALGFDHSNLLAVWITIILFMYICLNQTRMNIKNYLLFILCSICIYIITISRTSLIVSIFIYTILLINYYIGIPRTIFNFSKYIYFVFMWLSIYLPLNLSSTGFIRILDKWLSYRLTLSKMYLDNFSIGWFHTYISASKFKDIAKYYILDSGYLNLLYSFGIVESIVFMVLNILLIKKLLKQQKDIYVIVIIGLAIYSFTEDVLCSLQYNFTLLLLAGLLYSHGGGNKERRNRMKGYEIERYDGI